MPRKYKIRVGDHGYTVDSRTLESVPGSHRVPETVTAVDLRDLEPLVEAVRSARQLLFKGRWGDAHTQLVAALKAFEEDSDG